jgi:hypothetical protein
LAIKVTRSKQTLFSRIGLFLARERTGLRISRLSACQLRKTLLLECILSLKAFRKCSIRTVTLMEGTQNHGKSGGEEENLNGEKLQCSWRETFSFSSFPFVLGVNEGFGDLL